jgi:hypothetical protein
MLTDTVSHYQTTFKVHPLLPGYRAIKGWETRPGIVVIDTYTASAQSACVRACRLFSALGATGCIMSFVTSLEDAAEEYDFE